MKIISNLPGFSSGQVGSVVFVKGVAHTDDERMLAHFSEHPDSFEVFPDDEQGEQDPPAEPNGGTPAPEADAYDGLTDDQVAEAYATNVAGNATTRKGQVKALRKLDADSDESNEDDDTQE